MTYKDGVCNITSDALRLLMRAAKAMPEEKLFWKPLDNGRTAMNQLAECTQVAAWFERILREKDASFLTPEFFAQQHADRDRFKSLADVEAEIGPAYEAFNQAVQAVSDEDCDKTVQMMPGWEATLSEVMYFPLRNLYYHFGQLNYIQTLYGDFGMH